MANTTLSVSSNLPQSLQGNVRVIEGVAGSGTNGRSVTIDAGQVDGYRFVEWQITKSYPRYAYVEGPYNSVEEACNVSATVISGQVELFIKGNTLYTDASGVSEAATGYYKVLQGTDIFRENSYFRYIRTGNIEEVTTCPSTNGGGSPGSGGTGGTGIDDGDTGVLPPGGDEPIR